MKPKRLYSIEEAADYLAISPKTIRNGLGRRAKKPFPVPHKKWGRRVVFHIKDLRAFADNLPYAALDKQSSVSPVGP
jgi:hypothetical protein